MQFIDKKTKAENAYTACSVRHGEAEVWLGPSPFFLSSSQGHSSSLTYKPPTLALKPSSVWLSERTFSKKAPIYPFH